MRASLRRSKSGAGALLLWTLKVFWAWAAIVLWLEELRVAMKAALWVEILRSLLALRSEMSGRPLHRMVRAEAVLRWRQWAVKLLTRSFLLWIAVVHFGLLLRTRARFFAAGSFLSWLALWLEFFSGNSSVGIAVVFAEFCHGVFDFGGIDGSVAVLVEHPEDACGWALLLGSRSWRGLFGFGRILRAEHDAGDDECDCGGDGYFCIHGV